MDEYDELLKDILQKYKVIQQQPDETTIVALKIILTTFIVVIVIYVTISLFYVINEFLAEQLIRLALYQQP